MKSQTHQKLQAFENLSSVEANCRLVGERTPLRPQQGSQAPWITHTNCIQRTACLWRTACKRYM